MGSTRRLLGAAQPAESVDREDLALLEERAPRKALGVFKAAFNPGRIVIGEHKRGVL